MAAKKKQRETKKAKRPVYKTKWETERNRFASDSQQYKQKIKMFQLVKRMNKTNQDVIGVHYMRNDGGVLEVIRIQSSLENLWKIF